MGILFSLISKFDKTFEDFSRFGFNLRKVTDVPDELFYVPSMWIGKVGWGEGIEKNIVRCYPGGFSFWHGKAEDLEEWYCPYENIKNFRYPLRIPWFSPIMTIKNDQSEIECMMGAGADYIKQKISCK